VSDWLADYLEWKANNLEPWTPPDQAPTTTGPSELRARAAELESRVPPIHAGPRTDDERMWLEKSAALRSEADRLENL
jgi:hypothetical protein